MQQARVCHRTVTYVNGERSRRYPLPDGMDAPAFITTDDGVRLEKVLVFDIEPEPEMSEELHWRREMADATCSAEDMDDIAPRPCGDCGATWEESACAACGECESCRCTCPASRAVPMPRGLAA